MEEIKVIEQEEKIYTQADYDRAVSKAYEEMKLKHEDKQRKKLQEIEVIAEAQAKQKFKAEYEEIDRQYQELNQRMTQNNLKLMEELSNKTRGKK